jgi:rubrerythrin
MEIFSISEVIDQAVEIEEHGYKFYVEMSKRFKENKKFNKLFDTLAEKELVHEKKFAELKKKVKDDAVEGEEEVMPYLKAIVESAFFIGKDKPLNAIKNVKTIAEAIDRALDFEKETLLYFMGIKDTLKSKGIVDEIIGEEKSHIVWLNKFRQSL